MAIEFDIYDLEGLTNYWLPSLEKKLGEVHAYKITTAKVRGIRKIYLYATMILSNGKEYEWGETFTIDEFSRKIDAYLETANSNFYYSMTRAQREITTGSPFQEGLE